MRTFAFCGLYPSPLINQPFPLLSGLVAPPHPLAAPIPFCPLSSVSSALWTAVDGRPGEWAGLKRRAGRNCVVPNSAARGAGRRRAQRKRSVAWWAGAAPPTPPPSPVQCDRYPVSQHGQPAGSVPALRPPQAAPDRKWMCWDRSWELGGTLGL